MNTNSFDELSIILDHIPYKFDYLMGVVYRKVLEDSEKRRCLQALRTLKDIEDYVSRNEFDMIILTYPELHMPVVLNRTELGWVKQTEELANWITEHWKSELLIISVS